MNDVFDCLPIAATIDNTIFCVHGGIPRPTPGKVFSISLINLIPIPYHLTPHLLEDPSEQYPEYPQDHQHIYLEHIHQLMIDLLWSSSSSWTQLTPFGLGGEASCEQKAIKDFLDHNQLTHIFQAQKASMNYSSIRKEAKVITIMSTSKVSGE